MLVVELDDIPPAEQGAQDPRQSSQRVRAFLCSSDWTNEFAISGFKRPFTSTDGLPFLRTSIDIWPPFTKARTRRKLVHVTLHTSLLVCRSRRQFRQQRNQPKTKTRIRLCRAARIANLNLRSLMKWNRQSRPRE
jgi:hypothetical protein